MVERGPLVTVGSILLAVVLWYGLSTFTDAPDWALWAVLLGVGVLLPRVLRKRV